MRTTAPGVVLALLLVGACAPGTPDTDSWRGDASRATGDVLSEVATVQLALEQRDGLFGTYLQTVVVDAEEGAGQAAQKLSAVQPPGPEVERHAEVTSELQDAASLLTDVRIAVVRGAPVQEYVGQLADVADTLDRLEKSLERPSGGNE